MVQATAMNYLQTDLSPQLVCDAVFEATGKLQPPERVETPAQGINNQTFLLRDAGLVLKMRPAPDGPQYTPCPHWPAYTCALFGGVPNGGLESIPKVTELLQRHGWLEVPKVFSYDDSARRLNGPFLIGALLPGRQFDWHEHVMSKTAAAQLGEHLGRLHAETARTDGFGIFEDPSYPLSDWWLHFSESFNLLADELCDLSPLLCSARTRMHKLLATALSAPKPDKAALICIDQNPSHYLGGEDGAISGFVDIEGHLWAPPEWELASVLAWVRHERAFRDAYRRFSPWPLTMSKVRPAYTCYTYLEWIYCLRHMTNRQKEVETLEEALARLLKVDVGNQREK